MARALDDLPLTVTQTTEVPRGRVRRPSEKVQAMLEEHQQEKQATEQRAMAKTKRREELVLKRKQVSKAAEQDLTKLSSNKARDDNMSPNPLPIALAPDNAFASRVVQSTNSINARANLASHLSVRKGSVPPVPMKAVKGTGMLPPRNRALTPGQLVKLQQLKRQATPHPSALSHTTTPKRIARRETPQSTNNDDNGGDTEPATDSDTWVPRKRARHATRSVPSDDDEPEGHDLSEGAVNVKFEDSLNSSDSFRVIALSQGTTSNPAATNELVTTKAVRLGRPRAGDLDAARRTLLQTAIQIFCTILLSDDPFPSAAQEEQWAQFAWEMSCAHHKININHDPTVIQLTTARTSHFRGQFKSRARVAVKNEYGFKTGRVDEDGMKRNRALVAELKKASAFMYLKRGASIEKHTGIYANPAIQEVINEVLFKRDPCDGLRWAKYYSPFPRVGFALTLTAIECAIDEWATGVRQDIHFKEEDYLSVFTGHVNALHEFHEMTAQYKLLPTILQDVFDNGRANAGVVEPAVPKEKQAVPTCAFLNALREYELKNGIETTASLSKGIDDSRNEENQDDLLLFDIGEQEQGAEEQRHYGYADYSEDAEGSDVDGEDGNM